MGWGSAGRPEGLRYGCPAEGTRRAGRGNAGAPVGQGLQALPDTVVLFDQNPPSKDKNPNPVVDTPLIGDLRITLDSGAAEFAIEREAAADPRFGAAAEEPSPP